MQTNLNDMLEKEEQLSYIFLIDVIYQIAKGMFYLHDMHIAHCELKPQNILVNVIKTKIMNKIVQHAFVKVIDFRISKIEVGSNPKTTKNKFPYGTVAYMAPEVLKSKFETITMCPFEADVYSFAMVCSKILSKKDPFDGVYGMKEILERIEKDERPNLLSNCDDLIELIQECWRLNPLDQPKFANICERLNLLKKKFLIGIEAANAPYFGVSNKKCYQITRFQQIHNRLPLDQSQIEDVVPMDDILASNGSTLIATTRNSKAIKHCGKKVCEINIKELDEETSTKLFITHSCGQENLPNELVEVGKEIVRACNGLPLSLRVMGAFLRDKKRLRCWE
uniref:Protein kinase domain-containing protein n=1 Tax=Physcomitrium patens TaxID=3218 RepID=A0A2K1JMT1_PHYPA|nr:hypothetical protein PHYPA_017685 [Physcomitrium patens]